MTHRNLLTNGANPIRLMELQLLLSLLLLLLMILLLLLQHMADRGELEQLLAAMGRRCEGLLQRFIVSIQGGMFWI